MTGWRHANHKTRTLNKRLECGLSSDDKAGTSRVLAMSDLTVTDDTFRQGRSLEDEAANAADSISIDLWNRVNN